MARRTYGPATKEKKAIVSGGIALCALTLILTVTASVMVVSYLNSSADRAFASTLEQYESGAKPPGQDGSPVTAPTAPVRTDPSVSEPATADPPVTSSSPVDSTVDETVPATNTVDTDPPQASRQPADGGLVSADTPEPEASTGSGSSQGTETKVPPSQDPVSPGPTRPDKLGRPDGPVVSRRPSDNTPVTTTDPAPTDTDAAPSGRDGNGNVGDPPVGKPDGTAADGNAGGDGNVIQPSAPDTEGSIVTYVVEPGDTLGGIASRFGVGVDDIVTANGIANKNVIFAGQVLTIPGGMPGQGMASPNTGPED